jgi:hypothetical protein
MEHNYNSHRYTICHEHQELFCTWSWPDVNWFILKNRHELGRLWDVYWIRSEGSTEVDMDFPYF